MTQKPVRRPSWLKVKPFSGERYHQISKRLRGLALHTVCEQANCPNRGECFNSGTATFLLMGPVCSRNCRFCNISVGKPHPLNPEEPRKIAQLSAALNLSHVVVTSVTRDDLPDEGAGWFRQTVIEIRKLLPQATIEILTPDFHGKTDLLDLALEQKPEVFNHNVETIPRLYSLVRPQADYLRSLSVLHYAAVNFPEVWVKSGIMVGLGETIGELKKVFGNLGSAGVKILTIGQYLPPTKDHFPFAKYYSPEEFEHLKSLAESHNIPLVVSGPLVRSSYRAAELID